MKSGTDGANGGQSDRNAQTITEALHPLIKTGELRIPRCGYPSPPGNGLTPGAVRTRFRTADAGGPAKSGRLRPRLAVPSRTTERSATIPVGGTRRPAAPYPRP